MSEIEKIKWKELKKTLRSCITLCCSNPVLSLNPRKQLKKGLISYYKTNGITCLRKHVDRDHSIIFRFFEKEVNDSRRGKLYKQHEMKWKSLVLPFLIFFCFKSSFQKKMWNKKIVCGAPCIFYSQKSLAITICGECMAKMSSITFVFLCSISFLKVFFTQCSTCLMDKTNVFYFFFRIIIVPLLIYGCPRAHMMCLL